MKKYTTMVISESNLKRIIVESIKDTLVEMKGFIDERLFELAGIIYDKCQMEIKNKKYFFDFVVPIETIKRYCPYEIFFPLKIQVGVGITSGLLEYDNHKILMELYTCCPDNFKRKAVGNKTCGFLLFKIVH